PSFHLVPGPPRRYQRPFIEPGVASLPQITARLFRKTVKFSAVRGEEQSGSARGFESPQRVLCNLLRWRVAGAPDGRPAHLSGKLQLGRPRARKKKKLVRAGGDASHNARKIRQDDSRVRLR